MFGSSKPVVFDPYGSRRKRRRIPPWLLLMLTGIAAGAAGVIVVQERYLPPRLSAAAAATLRSAYEQADADRQRLARELGDTTKRLDATLSEKKTLGDELSASRAMVERLRDGVAAVVSALPPDPRGGQVEVRAARFSVSGGALAYNLVLTRDRVAGKALPIVTQFVVAGESARGSESSVTLGPVAAALAEHEVVGGTLPLPEGFKPRQATVQVLDRAGGKLLGMRVILVR